MAINRLALANPAASTDTLLYTSNRNALISIIATNKSASTAASVRIWVKPSGATLDSQYSYMTYDTTIPILNTLETFRFPIVDGDQVYVRSSTANVSFSLSGIYESNGTSNIKAGTSLPSSPVIGDVFVNTSTSGVLYWTGSSWVNGVVDTSLYPFSVFQPTAPTSPVLGQIWVNSTDNSTYIWSGAAWIATTSPGSSYQASAPSAPKTGQLWINSSTGVQSVWTGSAWLALSDPSTVTLAAVQTMTNKTLTEPIINNAIINNAVTTVGTNAQVSSYTLVLSDRDKIVEISNVSANTLTIPLNSSVAYPVGSQVQILQTGTGQTTLTPTGGVTLNGTPGLKLRAQWSSATLIKRATDTWIAIGDLSA
jgi:hypothetical protein